MKADLRKSRMNHHDRNLLYGCSIHISWRKWTLQGLCLIVDFILTGQTMLNYLGSSKRILMRILLIVEISIPAGH